MNFVRRDHLLRKELGRPVLKDRAPVRIALVYPNRYEVGMASLGFQTVYRMFNEHPSVRCERVFYDDLKNGSIRSFESQESLKQFDLIGFSVSFELDIPNVIRILMQAGIPPKSLERTQAHPLVFIGGAIGGLNPSPLLPFIDGLLAGEGEDVFHSMADALELHRPGVHVREKRLEALSGLKGVFLPGKQASVKKNIVNPLIPPPAYTPVVTPYSHFADMFVIETARGCPKGCLFCASCKMSHPFRVHSLQNVVDAINRFNTGAIKIGLEGAGLSDYPDLIPLCRAVAETGRTVSFSSIRADRISDELVAILESNRVRSFTIAPEAGSESLRRFIGKEMTDSLLTDKVKLLSQAQMDILKLYYLIGLPYESEEDIDSLIHSVEMIAEIFLEKKKSRKIRLSINAFIPKAFTEFQWSAMNTEKELVRKRKKIANALKKEKRIVLVPKSAREEIFQGILSQGDETAGLAIYQAIQHKKGFQQGFAEAGVDPIRILFREKLPDETMPWDFIETDIPKERLWKRISGGEHGTNRFGNGRSETNRLRDFMRAG